MNRTADSPTAPTRAARVAQDDRTDLSPKKRELLELLLAERRKERSERKAAGAEPIPRADRSGPLPLSFVQQRLWFLSQLDPASPAYNIPAAVYLVGPLDAGLLARAYQEVVARHEGLRTNFRRNRQGEPYAVLRPELRLPMPVIDLSAVSAHPSRSLEEGLAAAEEMAQDLVPVVTMIPFDLTADPLVRLRLVRLAPEAHVLLLVVHHIVVDVWSIGVFFREVGALYDELAAGRPPTIEPLPIQYPDYVEWQVRTLVEGGELDRQLEYWVGRLEGAPPVIELPTDYPRPPVQTFRGKRYAMHLGGDVHERLRALARPEEATLYMAALAVFYALLHRYTGQRDLLVGTPMANRNRVEFESLIGFFVNTVVLRAQVDGETTFRQLLRAVRTTALGAFAHHDLPFDRVVNALGLERDLSRNPLYQVDFAFQNLPKVELSTPGLSLEPFVLRETTSRFDLELDLKEADDGFDGFIRFNTALFDPATIERMGRHFETLLRAVLAEPDRPVGALPMLAEDEAAQILARGVGPRGGEGESDLPAPVRIAAWAERTPDAAAVVGADGAEVSFGVLRERTVLLARRLAAGAAGRAAESVGSAADPVVALAISRSADLVTALLAVWEAGAAYLPLDTANPPERLRAILDDAGVRRVVTTQEVAAAVPVLGEGGRELVLLGDVPDGAPAAGRQPPPPRVPDPLAAAYVIYTSGSTGKPKGVVVSHGALANYLTWCREAYGAGEGSGSLVHSSLGFDLTVTSLLAPLAAGKPVRLVVESQGIEPFADALVESNDLGLLKLTPAHLEALGGLLADGDVAGRARTVVIGGEALHWSVLGFWRRNAPASRLVNEYGPTETTVGCTAYFVEPDEERASGETEAGGRTAPEAGSVAIGDPIRNTSVRLLDDGFRLVPDGVVGEIVVGGAGVARGYLGRPAATAERFVPDPFAEADGVSGARVYRTGDRARRDRAGRLVFLGRMDDQAKVRGHRIEPGEVEALLDEHPGVQAVAVLVRSDLPGGSGGSTGLVAYVAAPKARNLRDEDLRAHLAERVPEYMIPAFFVFLPSLPLTVNGKIDRRALPAPDAVGARDADYVAPRTPTEVQVARIWSEVLRVDRVSVNDRFFELGGQSMLAVQVISRVRDALQAELPVQALFNETTVASLAAEIDAGGAAAADAPPIVPVPRPGEGGPDLPLSFSQERLWLVDRLRPGLTAYHIPGAVRMRGELDRSALERALGTIVERHEVLRTTFAERGGRPVQVIHDEMPLALVRVDLRRVPEAEREARARELALDAIRAPFDLARGPLLRALLVELAQDEVLFVLAIHHIVYDMWSRDVFLGELITLYEAYADGRPSNLPPLALQYADYAVWQREWLSGEVLEAEIGFWRERLEGIEPLELPADRPRPAVQDFQGGRVSRVLDAGLTRSLKRRARRQKVTLYVALLSGFYALLHRYTGRSDLVVGSPIANRNRTEVEPLMGFFANTLALRSEVEPGTSGAELMDRVRETTLESFSHQDLAFEKLVEALQPERDLGRQPLFQVLFNFLINYEPPAVELPRLTLEAETVHTGGVPFDFALSMYEADERLHVMVDYGRDLFDPTTVERMTAHFERLLDGLATRPGEAVGALPLLAPGERQQALVEWNAPSSGGAPEPVPERIARAAAAYPDRVALCGDGETLTYGALEARSARLSARLRRLGVGPESRVGVCLARSPALAVALYAVWKAGAAYVPLDPAYPAARLDYLLEDSGARVWMEDGSAPAGVGEGLERVDPRELAGLAPFPEEAGTSTEEAGTSTGTSAPASPDRLAYTIYTSGSTGVPKGVDVGYGALARLAAWHEAAFEVTSADRASHVAGLGFDASVWELWPHLAAGARVELVPEPVRTSPEGLRDWLLARQVTVSFLPTPVAEAALGLDWPQPVALRTLLTGGDRLRRRPRPGLPFTLVNDYGPTECAVVATSAPVAPAGGAPAIGRPVGRVTAHAADAALRPLPIGVPGELVLGGEHLARGYSGRPAASAERFVPDPFAGLPGARLYRTGDLVRRRTDGGFDFLGRIDEQIEVRGHRIEPGEIEAALGSLPEVAACAVVAPEGPDGSRRLVAWVVPADGAGGEGFDGSALARTLSERLPDALVPRTIVALDALPLTANGKIDRAALVARSPEPERTEPVAPRNELEATLALAWAELLGRERVGVHDDFFALGGHSLLASRLVSRLREELDLDLPLRVVFERPTIAGLAETVESLRWLEGASGGVEGEEEGEL